MKRRAASYTTTDRLRINNCMAACRLWPLCYRPPQSTLSSQVVTSGTSKLVPDSPVVWQQQQQQQQLQGWRLNDGCQGSWRMRRQECMHTWAPPLRHPSVADKKQRRISVIQRAGAVRQTDTASACRACHPRRCRAYPARARRVCFTGRRVIRATRAVIAVAVTPTLPPTVRARRNKTALMPLLAYRSHSAVLKCQRDHRRA